MQCDYDLCEKCFNKYYDKNYIIINDEPNNRSLYLFQKKYLSEVHKHPLIFLIKVQIKVVLVMANFFLINVLMGLLILIKQKIYQDLDANNAILIYVKIV